MSSNGQPLAGKVALTMGATSGVGKAIAEGWTARGPAIVATGRREELGKSLEYTVQQAGGRLTFVSAGLVGILHGCLKTGVACDEKTAWAHHKTAAA